MNLHNIFEDKMKNVCQNIFRKGIDLNKPRNEIEEWDSLNHIKLIIAFEEEFQVRVPIEEIQKINTLSDFKKFMD